MKQNKLINELENDREQQCQQFLHTIIPFLRIFQNPVHSKYANLNDVYNSNSKPSSPYSIIDV